MLGRERRKKKKNKEKTTQWWKRCSVREKEKAV